MEGINCMDDVKMIHSKGREELRDDFHAFVQSKENALRKAVSSDWLDFESRLCGDWSRQIGSISTKLSHSSNKNWQENNAEVVEFLERIGYQFKKK